MNRYRIMNSAGDSLFGHRPEHPVTIVNSDCINVINVLIVRRSERRADLVDATEQFVVKLGMRPPSRIPRIQLLELHAQDSPLNAVHPRVPTDVRVEVFARL